MLKQGGRVVSAALLASLAAVAEARETVPFPEAVQPGTVVVRTAERQLYFVLGGGTALRYPVAVGRPGKQWAGTAVIDGKHVKPDWSPPAEIRRDNPRLPRVIPGGSPRNPMGARALTLRGGEYAIHGTNAPGSIGAFASRLCIRMYNHDIVDLFERVEVSTPVVVR